MNGFKTFRTIFLSTHPVHEKNKYELISLYNGMSTQAKIVLGLCGVFVASATVFVVYDSLSEKTVRILVYLKKCNLSTDHRKQHAPCVKLHHGHSSFLWLIV